jgi:hypothetical protein
MRLQGQYRVRNMLHHVCCVISRSHFLVSKNAPETLFQEGQRLYGEQRYSEAAKSWSQAALLQHAPAHAFLSNMLLEGRIDVQKDEQRAFEFASGGAVLGCSHSKGVLARCILYHPSAQNHHRNDIKCLALAMESAQAGSPFGKFAMAQLYSKGFVVPKDDAETMRFLEEAARAGHAEAMCALAHLIGQIGAYPDYKKVVNLLRGAVDQGHVLALCNLGCMYKHGQVVCENLDEAERLFFLAAQQGNSLGLAMLKDVIKMKLKRQMKLEFMQKIKTVEKQLGLR